MKPALMKPDSMKPDSMKPDSMTASSIGSVLMSSALIGTVLTRSAPMLFARFAATVLLFLSAIGSAYAIDPLPFKDRAEEVRFQNLTKQLRCLVCQNQDLADSDAALAGDLRKQVFDMMQAGKSDAEIKQYLVDRYNDFVLYDPPVKPGTWLLWFTPFVLVLIGAVVLVRIVRARARQAVALQAGAKGITQSEDDDW